MQKCMLLFMYECEWHALAGWVEVRCDENAIIIATWHTHTRKYSSKSNAYRQLMLIWTIATGLLWLSAAPGAVYSPPGCCLASQRCDDEKWQMQQIHSTMVSECFVQRWLCTLRSQTHIRWPRMIAIIDKSTNANNNLISFCTDFTKQKTKMKKIRQKCAAVYWMRMCAIHLVTPQQLNVSILNNIAVQNVRWIWWVEYTTRMPFLLRMHWPWLYLWLYIPTYSWCAPVDRTTHLLYIYSIL